MAFMELRVGSIVQGRVTGLSKFGAFVELPDGRTGLVHISEVADAYVKDIADYLHEQDIVRVKVIEFGQGNKIGLSIKQASFSAPPPVFSPATAASSEGFEEKLGRFMKDSNEKLVALKRHQEGRKGR